MTYIKVFKQFKLNHINKERTHDNKHVCGIFVYMYINIYACIYIYIYIYIFFFFPPVGLFTNKGVASTEEQGNSCVPDSFFTVVLGCEPQQGLRFHSQPSGCFIHPTGYSPTACHRPLHTLHHSFLFCMLIFASWMFRPFLASFTPPIQHLLAFLYF